ncbi:NRDE family protein [Leucobacter albus]|uniref:NRDE family protein n=1 Tax=Leucobacter albus TaxID=272210 RepID=A0ABW3TI44_9MICO
MCTVVIEVPQDTSTPTRVLAVRDEDPNRPWDPPGEWWPEEHPGTLGVRDRRANGAWLALAPQAGRLAVMVNRAAEMTEPAGGFTSRGGLVLASVAGDAVADPPTAAPFSLVEVDGHSARVTAWDGVRLRREELSPGIHMLAHHDVDDNRSERIARWLPEFHRLAGAPQESWRARWLELLARTAELEPTHDEAIVRDNRPLGYPTLSLLACVADVAADSVELEWAPFTPPGTWGDPLFRAA